MMSNAEIVRLKNGVNDHDHSQGPGSAPVTLLEYGNFECSDCRRAYPVIKKVQKVLNVNLRFIFRHFPTVRTHPHSLRAAEAAEAASVQGKFWEMHDQLYTHQQALDDDDLSRYAARIGLDIDTFTRCMADKTFLKQIEVDYQRALFDEHITGTPTFYINDVRYTGAIDEENLVLAIREADTEGRIPLPEMSGRLKRIFRRLHFRASN